MIHTDIKWLNIHTDAREMHSIFLHTFKYNYYLSTKILFLSKKNLIARSSYIHLHAHSHSYSSSIYTPIRKLLDICREYCARMWFFAQYYLAIKFIIEHDICGWKYFVRKVRAFKSYFFFLHIYKFTLLLYICIKWYCFSQCKIGRNYTFQNTWL